MRNSNNNKNTLKLFILNLIIIGIVFAGFYFMKGNSQIVEVQTIALNVRESPSVESRIISQVHREDEVTITEKKGAWYQITTPNKTVGWVAEWLIFDGISGPYTSLPAIVTQRNVELKKSNHTSSKSLTTLKRKQKVMVTLELNDWVRIKVDDETGWVPSDSIAIRKKQRHKNDEGDTLHIATESTTLYKDASSTSHVLTHLEYGDTVTFKEESEHWYRISTRNGTVGYINDWETTPLAIKKKEDRPTTPMAEYTILLDPGHGGNDPGAETNDGTVFEKNLTLATAKTVKSTLEEHGFNVLMTRSTDEFVSLEGITDISNKSNANAFISFHYDSSAEANQGSGTTTFYRHKDSKQLAQTINDKIASLLPLDNRGFGNQDYQVLRDNKKPAILLELGYINNDIDAQYAQNKKYHQKVGDAVYGGLMTYFNTDTTTTK
ncbi:MAG: N-acetylmuramoyl-L-alanine amidase [Vagococcus sp.]